MEGINDCFPDVINRSQRLVKERFQNADAAFLSGSILSGENTPESDYDFVVVYQQLDCAFRESFIFEGRKIETFNHDLQTLLYFFEKIDRRIPALASMIDQGLIVKNENGIADRVKALAHQLLILGPDPVLSEEIEDMRYKITDLCDDLKYPASYEESIAIAAKLYPVLADFFLRTRGYWSADGKMIPRAIRQIDPEFALKFNEAFRLLYQSEMTYGVIKLAEELLEDYGGTLFDGYIRKAPSKFRRKRTKLKLIRRS
jgi:predicted nucleotidyltransferase